MCGGGSDGYWYIRRVAVGAAAAGHPGRRARIYGPGSDAASCDRPRPTSRRYARMDLRKCVLARVSVCVCVRVE